MPGRLTQEENIAQFREVHGDRYDYSQVKCINTQTKVKIICPEHGAFMQTPASHKKGSGCPACSSGGFNPDKPGFLYYILDLHTGMYKVGVTNYTLKKRFRKCTKRIHLIYIREYRLGKDAYLEEQRILNEFSYARATNTDWPEDVGGQTEFFDRDVLLLDDKHMK